MRIFVTGATGALGRHLVPGLIAAGHEVTAATRTPGKVAQLREAGAEPVILDGLDRKAVIAAVRAAAPEVIVHQMTALAGLRSLRHPDKAFAATNELRTRGTDNLLAAAAAAGSGRVIAQGYAGAAPDQLSGGGLKTEEDPPDWRPIRSAVHGPAAIRQVEEAVPAGAPEGIVLRYGNFYGPGASDFLLDMLRKRRLADQRTRLIGVSHVPTSGGLVQPAAEIGRIARGCGALYLLDATQSAGQFPVDVDAIGCDLLTGTGRKFLRGPRGTGFLWVRAAALDRLDPFVAEIGSAGWDGHHGFTWAPGAQRFATWEHSYASVLGLGAAVRQALDLGLEAIGQHAEALVLRGQLAGLPGVTVHDLCQVRCAIVTAKIDHLAAPQAAQALARAGVNVSTTVPEHNPLDTQDHGVHPLIRFSPHYYNTDDEIDRTIELVAALAR